MQEGFTTYSWGGGVLRKKFNKLNKTDLFKVLFFKLQCRFFGTDVTLSLHLSVPKKTYIKV